MRAGRDTKFLPSSVSASYSFSEAGSRLIGAQGADCFLTAVESIENRDESCQR